jgi:pimeloyl-ACP methyl ester carboxylesterase
MLHRLSSAIVLLAAVMSDDAQAYRGDQIYASPGQPIDIGHRKLNLYCTGTGTPTIVLESGLGGRASAWARVQSALSRTVRVCSYDRAGYAFSDPGPQPRTAERLVADLHAALTNSKVPRPYILAGATFGAFVIRLFAARHSTEVAGMVLLNPSPEEEELTTASATVEHIDREGLQHARRCRDFATAGKLNGNGAETKGCLPGPNPELSPQLNAARTAMLRKPGTWAALVSEWEAIRESAAEVKAASAKTFSFPLVVISAGRETEFQGSPVDKAALHDAWRHWTAWQDDIARISTDSLHIRTKDDSRAAETTHPALVIAAIQKVIAAARNHSRLVR